MLFYAWGEPRFIFILLLIFAFNFTIALIIDRADDLCRLIGTAIGVCTNLLFLGILKYFDFVVINANWLVGENWISTAPLGILPLGISFITFHSISYLVDVHRQNVEANRNPLEVAVYLSLFPQLIAGPIVRYKTIYRQLHARRTTMGRASAGLRIFIIGLAQKVLIADETARIAEAVFDRAITPSFLESWLGVGAYTVQIYFDFMGYSNMAIGLALAIGFPFPRNFRLPYRSLSITEFWRRWHMTLSAWFRDYVYIPLGGSRSSNARTYINLGTVFLLCGLWHGANWTFLIWGIHHGVFLIFERAGLSQGLRATPRAVAWSYALFVVMTGWVWFRAKDFFHAVEMFKAMAGFNGFSSLTFSTEIVLYPSTLMAFLFGIAFSLFVLPPLRLGPVFSAIADTATISALLALSILAVAAGSHSPFLYFKF